MADPASSTKSIELAQHPSILEVTATTDAATDNFTHNFLAPRGLLAMSLQTKGSAYGSGTLAINGSNDGTNFVALPTAVSLGADGVKSVALADLGFKWYQLALTGSTNPAFTAYVAMNVGKK